MLVRISAIISFTLLILLQYGKISNYLFCEWQASYAQQLPDCNCTWILDGVFDGDNHSAAALTVSKEKSSDYVVNISFSLSQPDQRIISAFPFPESSACAVGFGQLSLRPPIS